MHFQYTAEYLLLSKQVAQLWQRDRVKLETISINAQHYSQNHAQKCIFGPPYVPIRRNVSGLFESFNAKKPCSRDYRENASLLVKQRISVSSPLFAGLRVTYAIHPQLVGNLLVCFL